MAGDDLNLPLQTQVLDTATPINNAVTNMQHDQLVQGQIAMQPLERQLLQTQIAGKQFENMDAQSQAYIRGHVMAGAILKPFLDAGNTDAAKEVLGRMSQDPIMGKDATNAMNMINSGQTDQLKQQVDGMVGFGTQMGFIHPDLKIVGPGEQMVDATGKTIAATSPWGAMGGVAPATGVGGATPPASVVSPAATEPAKSVAPPAPASGIPAPPQQGAAQPTSTQQGAPSMMVQGQPISNMPPAISQAVSGPRNEQYLSTLPPEVQPIIKSLANYDLNINQIPARNPLLKMQVISAVKNYSPSWTENGYSTIQEFTKGKTSGNVKSIETALNTLAQAKDASDTLGGVDHAWLLNSLVNHATNAYNEATNNPELNTYNTLAKNAADETSTAVNGAGNSALADRVNREGNFTAAQAPSARDAAFKASVQELMSRLNPVLEQFNRGTQSQAQGLDLLSPTARASYAKLMGITLPEQEQQQSSAAPAAGGWKYLGKVNP